MVITEIFRSIQGESTYAGLALHLRAADRLQPALHLVRHGLRIPRRQEDEHRRGAVRVGVRARLRAWQAAPALPLVELTGGEPLLQPEAVPLAERLLAAGHTVLVETSGERPIDVLPREVVKIVDVKCPDSGEGGTFRMENLEALDGKDEVKFVIASRRDYEFAREFTLQHDSPAACGRCCFLPSLPTPREPGRDSRRGCSRNGSWPTACRCGWACNCTSSSGTRRRRESDALCQVRRSTERGTIGTGRQSRGAAQRRHGFVRHRGHRAPNARGWRSCTPATASAPSAASAKRSMPSRIFRACASGWWCGSITSRRSAARR